MADRLDTALARLRTLSATIQRIVDHERTQDANLAALAGGLSAVNAKTQRVGATLTSIAVGATDTTITWPTAWPDTAYGVYTGIVSGAAAQGLLFAQLKTGTKTTTDCVVTVVNLGVTPITTAAIDVLGVRT
jgi:hypothetical protein